MSEHHPRGMSRWPAVLECACYKGVGETKDTQVGTEKHAALAQLLEHLRDNGHLPEQTSDDYLDKGVYRAAEMIRDCMIATDVPFGELHIEERVTLEDGTFGTADVWYANPERRSLVVWDFKTFRNLGRDYTAQLAGYALAICCALPFKVDGVSLRTLYGDSNEIDSVSLQREELEAFYLDAMAAFDKGEDGTAQPTQCNWCELCANLATCPACLAVAEKVRDTLADAPANIATYTPEKRAQVMLLAEFFVKWSKAVIDANKAVMMDGGSVRNDALGAAWGLKTKRGALKLDTPKACRELVARGVDVDIVRGELELPTAGFERAAKTVGIKGKALNELKERCGTRGEDTVQVVRI